MLLIGKGAEIPSISTIISCTVLSFRPVIATESNPGQAVQVAAGVVSPARFCCAYRAWSRAATAASPR